MNETQYAEGRTERDLPGFDNREAMDWTSADELTDRWAKLNEGDLEAAAGRLPLEQLRSLFMFVEGNVRQYRDRAEAAALLADRLRSIVRRSASFGQDEDAPKQAGY